MPWFQIVTILLLVLALIGMYRADLIAFNDLKKERKLTKGERRRHFEYLKSQLNKLILIMPEMEDVIINDVHYCGICDLSKGHYSMYNLRISEWYIDAVEPITLWVSLNMAYLEPSIRECMYRHTQRLDKEYADVIK